MQNRKKKRILAIDPGTRHIGIAVFDARNLLYYAVKTLEKKQTQRGTLFAGRELILRLIKDFRPQILAVEKTYFSNSRSSKLLNVFAREIAILGMKQNLQVKELATNTVRKALCGNGAASKKEVARVVASRYPELKSYLTSDRRWKEKYYFNMFDAVALGLVTPYSHKGN